MKMKRTISVLLLAFILAACGSSKEISGDPVYGLSLDKSNELSVPCPSGVHDVSYRNGQEMKCNEIGGVAVCVIMEEDRTSGLGAHYNFRLGIMNKSGESFNVSEKDVDGYYSKGGKLYALTRYDYKTVEKKLNRAKAWADVGRAMSEASNSYNESTRATSTTDVKIKDAQGRSIGRAEISTTDSEVIRSNREDRAQALSDVDALERNYIRDVTSEYMKINTVYDGDLFSTFIYFNRPKSDKIWLAVNVLGNDHVFEWDIE